MELFPSADEESWEYIKKVIDNCDYYACIVGGKYGTVHESGISYTELEYDYAQHKKIPTIAFVHSDTSQLVLAKCEADPARRAKLEKFTKKVRGKLCKNWINKEQLGALLSRSIVRLIEDRPGKGWIRGEIEGNNEAKPISKNDQADETYRIVKKLEIYIPSIQPVIDIINSSERSIEVEFEKITYSETHKGAYCVSLIRRDSKTGVLPIVIGGVEAQSIAIVVEQIAPKAPLTHDLYVLTIKKMGYVIQSVSIYDLVDGIFQAKIRLTKAADVIEIACRTSDALSIALRTGAPIFVSGFIWEAASLDRN